jgi:hypothetical protein
VSASEYMIRCANHSRMAAGAFFDRVFNDPAAMRLWFAHLITYSEALTLAGVYVPFTDIGGADPGSACL